MSISAQPSSDNANDGAVDERFAVLEQVDKVLVVEHMVTGECCGCCGDKIKTYDVMDKKGDRFWRVAKEDGNCCGCTCAKNVRDFSFIATDTDDHEVLKIHRTEPYCCNCCDQPVKIESPPGEPIGTIESVWSLTSTTYVIFDAAFPESPVLALEGPSCCRCPCSSRCCCSNDEKEFQVFFFEPNRKRHIGTLTKKWGGLVQEMFSDADTFGVDFPMNLEAKLKALLIGAVFMIDLFHFEKGPDARKAILSLPMLRTRTILDRDRAEINERRQLM